MGAAELSVRAARLGASAGVALRCSANWIQLAKFCTVGASGYAVNLAVYSVLLSAVPYLAAACCSFAVAVTNNYTWNRLWTFRQKRGHLAFQGVRFLLVSVFSLGANLAVLAVLVGVGIGEIPAQAGAIVVVTPINFLGNKLWSFRV